MARCKYTRKGAKDYYDDNVDRYYEERRQAFLQLIIDAAESYLDSVDGTECGPNVLDFCEDLEEEFEFPDEGDWLASEYECMLGDCADQKYEEYRERETGL